MCLRKILSAVLMSGAASLSSAGQIITPFATDLASTSYSSSSFYSGTPSDTAESAFNGGVWNKGDYGWGWIQADLGSIQTISQLKLTTAQTPDGLTQHKIFLTDTEFTDYDSFTSSDAGLAFPATSAINPIYSHSGDTISGTVFDILLSTPQSGRFLKIFTNNGPSWSALGDRGARVNWQQPAVVNNPPTNNSIPEPASLALFGLGFAGIGFSKKRKRG